MLKRQEVALQRSIRLLEDSNGRLKLALEATGMGVFDRSLVDDSLLWDEEMFHIFGEKPNTTMSGKLIFERSIHPEDSDRVRKEVGQLIESKKNKFQSELRILRLDGRLRYLKVAGQIIYSSEGIAKRIIGTCWDRTEEFQHSEELSRQRKMTHHNAKLAAIGELAAGVAHEINNPLTIINGFVNLLGKNLDQKTWDKQRILEVVKKIDTSTERIAKIVKGLKNFSRVDKDIISHFDLVETIDETISMLLGIYHKEGVNIVFDFNRVQKVIIQGNRGKIQQVLINLIANAKDATSEQEERHIGIRLEKEGERIRLHVHDNGPGIPQELKERVFEPFFTTKDVNKGTGIGLSLVHSIVAEHKGSIRIEDSEPSGVTFIIELPEIREKKWAA